MIKPDRLARIIRLDPKLAQRIDVRRGDVPWNAFMNRMIEDYLAKVDKIAKPATAESRKVVTGVKLPFIKPLQEAKPPNTGLQRSAWDSLGLGRPKAAPGSLFKKGKK